MRRRLTLQVSLHFSQQSFLGRGQKSLSFLEGFPGALDCSLASSCANKLLEMFQTLDGFPLVTRQRTGLPASFIRTYMFSVGKADFGSYKGPRTKGINFEI